MVDHDVDYSSIDYNFSHILITGNGDRLSRELVERIVQEFPEAELTLLEIGVSGADTADGACRVIRRERWTEGDSGLLYAAHYNQIFHLYDPSGAEAEHEEMFQALLEAAEAMGSLFLYCDRSLSDSGTAAHYGILDSYFSRYMDEHLTPALALSLPLLYGDGTEGSDRMLEALNGGALRLLHVEDALRFIMKAGVGHSSGKYSLGDGYFWSREAVEGEGGVSGRFIREGKDPEARAFMEEFRVEARRNPLDHFSEGELQ